MSHIRPPAAFNFREPQGWTRWITRFDQYRLASGLSGETEAKQVSTFLYCLGEEANDFLVTMGATDADRATYDAIKTKFVEFFDVRHNVIFERTRFNRRCQQPGETAEEFIVAVHSLADKCDFDRMKNELIRDRLVAGIQDSDLSERLQLNARLTLADAIKEIRQHEAVHENQKEMRPGDSKGNPLVLDGSQLQRRGQRDGYTCQRCGRAHQKRENCPAKDATCRRCGRRGHFAARCFSKTRLPPTKVDSTEDSSQPDPENQLMDTLFLDADEAAIDAIGDYTKTTTPRFWSAQVAVGSQEVAFKLDTGAEVTAISDSVHRALGNTALEQPSKILCGPSRKPLPVLGKFSITLSYRGRSSLQELYVVKGLRPNLLGLPAIVDLNIAARVDATTSSDIFSLYPTLFQGLGTMGEPYEIKLRPNYSPHAIFTPRRVPLPLREKVRHELERMESLGIISKVEEPTSWCAGIVAVPKKDGSVRICVDLRPLNLCVMRETHPLPKVDDILAQISGGVMFSKLDANSGFWQVPLAKNSQHLTTFLTHFGRYKFNKLPFGICSAPEVFQKRMNQILEGLQGVLCLIDDVLVFGRTEEEHGVRLHAVLQRLRSAGVTLNKKKCSFFLRSIKFLGHIVNQEGVAADPDKVSAVVQMASPQNVTEVRRFLGMVNQLAKFSPCVSEMSHPLRQLLSSKSDWTWNPMLEEAFVNLKMALSRPTILASYDVTAELKVSADASSHSLGAALLQRQSASHWKPVCYASRSLSPAEVNYAQIEKEALALTWACEKFQDYILGKSVLLETDHKPLVSLLSTKALDDLPPRVLRFRLRLARFHYAIQHVPGKKLHTADVLSRSVFLPFQGDSSPEDQERDMDLFVDSMITALPASSETLSRYKKGQANDPVCVQLRYYCQNGWPASKHSVDFTLRPFWKAKHKLSIVNDLLLYNQRIMVPGSLQEATVKKIHSGHLGIQKCLLRAKDSVWWPGYSSQIKAAVSNCQECAKHSTPNREPLMTSTLPQYPWQVVGADLFELNNVKYLLVVDYFSRFPEIIKLSSTTAPSVVSALKSTFARFGIPQSLRSDNGPQFNSNEMASFASSYGFAHDTSSPHYSQSNGQVERAVRTVKLLLKKADDPYLALLNYRSTPLSWCGHSPAELLMGRRIRTTLPILPDQLEPTWSFLEDFRLSDKRYKQQMTSNYNQRYRTRPLPVFKDSSPVYIRTPGRRQTTGIVKYQTPSPRSYYVETPSGGLRRNRQHLTPIPLPLFDSSPDSSMNTHPSPSPSPPVIRSPIQTRLRTGVIIKPPEKLTYS